MSNQASHSLSNVTLKSAAKYALLPGIVPRLQRLANHVARFLFMFVQIFGTIGLIDRAHPCLKYQNVGRYRFRDIIGLAASNLKFDRAHLPQTIMFFVVVGSFLMTLLMMVGLALTAVFYVSSSQAQFFSAPSGNEYQRSTDWALLFLYRVFGATNDMTPVSAGYNPWFGTLFMSMLRHYSFAMLFVAVFMILYILVITATEAARTGQPFGTRFDGIWAPIRLAMAIGLLIPVSAQGLNTAQLIVIQSAVWGSNLATNAWFSAIEHTGKQKFLAANLVNPGYRFVRDAFLINSCVAALQVMPNTLGGKWGDTGVKYYISYSGEKMNISFGPEKASDFCGQVSLLILPKTVPGPGTGSGGWPHMTAAAYQQIALSLLPMKALSANDLTPEGLNRLIVTADASGPAVLPAGHSMTKIVEGMAKETVGAGLNDYDYSDKVKKYGGTATEIQKWIQNNYREPLGYGPYKAPATGKGFFADGKFESAIESYNTWIVDSLRKDAKYGWTTAGVFYIRMSAAMGTISKVVENAPTVSQLPANFSKYYASPNNPRENAETVRAKCSGFWSFLANLFDDTCKKYELSLQVNGFLRASASWFETVVKNNSTVYSDFGVQAFDQGVKLPDKETPLNASTNVVFGPMLDALASGFKVDSTLNPLGVLIGMGDTLLNIGAIAYAVGMVGGSLGISSFAITVGSTMMLCGFVLMFWVPFMPFLYFTFAVIEWIVSVMEAVIGMPLWATTLISLEGDGLGKGMEGVKMIFEIVLRPTIIILSLLASVILFGASVDFVNKSMALYATASDGLSTGFLQNMMTSIGLIVVYMFTIYLLAQSCFKLITAIPDRFPTWGGLPQGFGSTLKMGPEGIKLLDSLIVGGAAYKAAEGVVGGARKAGGSAMQALGKLGK